KQLCMTDVKGLKEYSNEGWFPGARKAGPSVRVGHGYERPRRDGVRYQSQGTAKGANSLQRSGSEWRAVDRTHSQGQQTAFCEKFMRACYAFGNYFRCDPDTARGALRRRDAATRGAQGLYLSLADCWTSRIVETNRRVG